MKLSEFEMDGIREVMMIGAGHASTALAKALKREIDIKIPSVELCPLEDVPKKIGRPEDLSMGVYTEVSGDLKGRLLTLFSKDDAMRLEGMVSGEKIKKLTDVSQSTVTNVADILASSNLGAISDFFGMKISQSPSEIAYDMLGALLEQVLIELSQYSDTVLLSKTDIFVSHERFNCLQILFLDASSLEKLLKAMEIKL
ncbi:MAG: chemotaxis protein CheC [Desulfatiglandales bacterium]